VKIEPQISLDEFCSEMQHRVVRYSLRSIAVRSAIRFARKHENPEFYRVAMNKVHAQKLFQRELNGPGMLEKLFDYFSLGSLREVVVTLMLVGLAVFGIDAGRKYLNTNDRGSTSFDSMEVDQLAKRLGLLLEDSASSPRSLIRNNMTQSMPVSNPFTPRTSPPEESRNKISDADIARIVEAVLVAMNKKSDTESTISDVSTTPPPIGANVSVASSTGTGVADDGTPAFSNEAIGP
jgi:hypothetical protein